jgi:hypothetical protein
MVSSFEKRNYCALALALVVAGLTIAASLVSWYAQNDVYHRSTTSAADFSSNSPDSVISTTEFNYTKVVYDLSGYTITTKMSSGIVDSSFTAYANNTDLKTLFDTSLVFVALSLVLSLLVAVIVIVFFFDSIRNKIIFTFGMTITRVFLVLLSLLLVACLIVGFLAFLGLPAAFENELGTCTEGPCRTFTDSIQTEGLTDTEGSTTYALIRSQSWGPEAGWYLTLAAIPFALFLSIVMVINKLPLPIDSEASSGEAL